MAEFSLQTGRPTAGSAARVAEQAGAHADPAFRIAGGSAATIAGESPAAARVVVPSLLKPRSRERIFTPRPVPVDKQADDITSAEPSALANVQTALLSQEASPQRTHRDGTRQPPPAVVAAAGQERKTFKQFLQSVFTL